MVAVAGLIVMRSSGAGVTLRLAVDVLPVYEPVTVCAPAMAAVHVPPAHDPFGAIVNVLLAVTSPMLLLNASKACAV